MMKNDNNLKTSLEELKRLVKDPSSSNSAQTEKIFSDLEAKLLVKSKELKGFNNLFLFLIGVLIASLSYSIYQKEENETLSKRITCLERIDSVYNTFMEPRDGSISYRIDGKGNPISYRALMVESDSLIQKKTALENQLYETQFELRLIKQTYPVEMIHKGNTYRIESAKLDSALLLLEVYRDKLIYNDEGKFWEIKK